MDQNFEKEYQDAECAYAQGKYELASSIAQGLFDRLEQTNSQHDEAVIRGWRAVVSLLLANIQLHGLNQPVDAAHAYQRVLESQPEETLAELARQGLSRCQNRRDSSAELLQKAFNEQSIIQPVANNNADELLRDPFLKDAPEQAGLSTTHQATAMPWLEDEATSTTEPLIKPPDNNLLAQIVDPDPVQTFAEESDVGPVEQPIEQQAQPQDIKTTTPIEESWLRIKLSPQAGHSDQRPAPRPTGPMAWINRLRRRSARR